MSHLCARESEDVPRTGVFEGGGGGLEGGAACHYVVYEQDVFGNWHAGQNSKGVLYIGLSFGGAVGFALGSGVAGADEEICEYIETRSLRETRSRYIHKRAGNELGLVETAFAEAALGERERHYCEVCQIELGSVDINGEQGAERCGGYAVAAEFKCMD
jgi:hypothetical protein